MRSFKDHETPMGLTDDPIEVLIDLLEASFENLTNWVAKIGHRTPFHSEFGHQHGNHDGGSQQEALQHHVIELNDQQLGSAFAPLAQEQQTQQEPGERGLERPGLENRGLV